MWKDPVVEKTRKLRDDYAHQFNYSINEIFKDLMTKQAEHPDRVVAFPPRKPTLNNVAAPQSPPDNVCASRS